DLEYEDEDALVDVQGQALADLGEAGVVRGRLGQRDAEEGAQRQAVGAAPGDAALGVEALEVADQQHTEVDAGRDRVAALAVGVGGRAGILDVSVEARFCEEGIELVIEDMAGRGGEVRGSDPEVGLLLLRPATHAHARNPRSAYSAGWP